MAFNALEYANWLKSYAKSKKVTRYGGNFWGINRNRCAIIPPERITELAEGGYIIMQGPNQFIAT